MTHNYQEHEVTVSNAGWQYTVDVSYFKAAVSSIGYTPPEDAEVEFNVTNVENLGSGSYEDDLWSYEELEEYLITYLTDME